MARFPRETLALVGCLCALESGQARAAGVSSDARPPLHRIAVEVRGPVAMVQVTRVLYPEPADDRRTPGEVVLDVALPDRAALIDVDVQDSGHWRGADPMDPGRARDLYVEALRAHGLVPAAEPFDDSAVYRIRAAPSEPRPAGDRHARAPLALRYRFSAIADYSGGRRRLRFPAAPESLPVPAEVTVAVTGATDVEIAGARTVLGATSGGRAAGRASTRSGWEISWAPRAAGAPGDVPALEGALVSAPLGASESALAFAVEGRPGRATPPPASVLFLVDRSRSVGLPGLSAERDLARRLLEALPPTTRFDALFFDRAARRLFPMSRPATREAMSDLENEMVPDRLQNGTDLTGALREAGALLRREASAFAPRTLLVILTDGALAEGEDAPRLEEALGTVPGLDVQIAAFAVRIPEDDPVGPAAGQALRGLAGTHGGVLRAPRANEIEDAVPEALAALGQGGDLARVRLIAAGPGAAKGRADRAGGPGPGGTDGGASPLDRLLADKLSPGEGVAGITRLPSRATGTIELQGLVRGGKARLVLHPTAIDPGWLRPHLNEARMTRFAGTASVIALVEPVLRPPPPPAEPRVTGSLDRIVVRNTLSLAYMPRARACYLNRKVATPQLRDLSGRVRVAIDLVRGEVLATTIQSSTLNHPEIEDCLREGAFAIEVPRALHSDAPVTAILNLVFRPRTPEKVKVDDGVLGNQIDLVIEELHRSQREAGEHGNGHAHGQEGRDQIRPQAPPVP